MTTPTVRFRCAGRRATLAVVAPLIVVAAPARAQLAAPAEPVQPAAVLAPATAVVGAGVAGPARKPAIVKVVGTLTDAATGEPLVGGQVGVVGMPLGNVSDETGAYFINNVPVGRLTFKVEYLGYETLVQEHVVQRGAPNTLDFALQPTAFEGEEVLVEEESALDLSDYVERARVPSLKPADLREVEVEESDTTLMEAWHHAWRDFQPLYSIEYPMIGEQVYFRRPSTRPAPARLAPPPVEKDRAPIVEKVPVASRTTGSLGSEKRPAEPRPAFRPAGSRPVPAVAPAPTSPGQPVTPAPRAPAPTAPPSRQLAEQAVPGPSSRAASGSSQTAR